MPSELKWVPDPEWTSAKRAEHAIVGDYELVAFDITQPGEKTDIGWEVFTGRKFGEQVATGETKTFNEAKAAAEAAWLDVHNPKTVAGFIKDVASGGMPPVIDIWLAGFKDIGIRPSAEAAEAMIQALEERLDSDNAPIRKAITMCSDYLATFSAA